MVRARYPWPFLELGPGPISTAETENAVTTGTAIATTHWKPKGRLPRKETDSYDILPVRPSIINAAKAGHERGWLPKPKTQQPIRLILHELNIPLAHVTMRSSNARESLKFSLRLTNIIKQGMMFEI